jgi:hypothetical protein
MKKRNLLVGCVFIFGLLAGCQPKPGGEKMQVHFWVSNQSLGTDVDTVKIEVNLDGSNIFEKNMAVETQHNIAMVDQIVSIGTHNIEVEIGDPYNISKSAEVEIQYEKWIFVRFWFDPLSVHADQNTPTITIDEFDESPGIK